MSVWVGGGGCQLLSFVNSNPTMSLSKVYGLIRGDYGFAHLVHMASVLQLSVSQS